MQIPTQPISQKKKQLINSSQQNQQKPDPSEQFMQQSIKEQYQVLIKLGSGAYGHVWKVKEKKTNKLFALKKVFSAFQNDVDAQRTYREIVYLSKLKHQNVVKLHKVIKAENQNDIYLVFEYMQSDLFYAIKQNLLNELHKKYIIFQIANSLQYIHSCGLLHRDIKPSNILINPSCQIKLCDFGLSRTLYPYSTSILLTQFIATRWYRAPEVLFGSQQYSYKSDMWSLGCLIYQLYAGRPLLPGDDTIDQIRRVFEFKGKPNQREKKAFKVKNIDEIVGLFQIQKKSLEDYFKYIPTEQVKQLLIHLLQYNPEKRWTAEDLLNCNFLQQFRDAQIQPLPNKFIKTPIYDTQKKTVDIYRKTIYNTYIEGKPEKPQNSQKPLDKFKLSTFRSKQKRATQRISKKYNSSSMHTIRPGNQFPATQRLSSMHNHKKPISTHAGQNQKQRANKYFLKERLIGQQQKGYKFNLKPQKFNIHKPSNQKQNPYKNQSHNNSLHRAQRPQIFQYRNIFQNIQNKLKPFRKSQLQSPYTMHLKSNNKIERSTFASRDMIGSKDHSVSKDQLATNDYLVNRNMIIKNHSGNIKIASKYSFASKDHSVSKDHLETRNTSVGTTKNTSIVSSMNASLLMNNTSTTSKMNLKDGRKLKRKAKVNN